MRRVLSVSLVFIVAICVGALTAFAQKPVERSGNVSKTATITAINHSTRVVTLKDDQSHVEDIVCGPEIKRFNELKVGDSVTFTYHAAVVYEIAKPGATSAAAEESTVAGKGVKPSGAYTRQQKLTVTVEAIDPSVPSVTVKGPNGNSMSAEVKDKKNLEGLKVGDQVSITFTEAVMIVVEPPKK